MSTEVQQPGMQTTVAPREVTKPRLTSLDVFRGMTIAAMMLVNNAGDWEHVYWPLEHAEWNGWTPTDLIFPFFLFIVGVSMVLSFDSRRAKGASRGELLTHSLKRAAIIFAMGLFLNAYPEFNLHALRFAGVLQRIAVVYLISSAIVLYCGRKVRWFITAALLLGYWALMKLVPVPGCGAGLLTMDCSPAGYVDRAVMYNHLWVAHRFDPEGFVSTLPAIATCLLGVFTGEWMRGKSGERLIRGFLTGAVIGLGLGKVWNVWFPINKNLWTSSYVLFTAGFALAVLAFCYWTVDVRGWKKWAQPFVWYGVNPLALYFLAGWLAHTTTLHISSGRTLKDIVYSGLYAHLTGNPYVNSMLYGLTYVLLCLLVAWVMYRKKVFIKV
ncbi:MAG: acyltransferase family protein [Terriglobales bacterium]